MHCNRKYNRIKSLKEQWFIHGKERNDQIMYFTTLF